MTDLTLKDVDISVTSGSANLINFNGEGNKLTFAGICVLEKDTNATGYAMIHVNENTSLTISGKTAYLYKREQGAGIGGNGGADAEQGDEGQPYENNGKITFDNAKLFMKGSKQGALIGAGAQASAAATDPGEVIIKDSNLTLLGKARGAVIGGSAGSNGASKGTDVHVTDSILTINVDYSGAAIGGGGFASGNESGGGTLYTSGSSIRAFIDYNAVDPNGDGLESSSDTLWDGITEPGVNNNAAITADIVNIDGSSPLYLLEFDTSKLTDETDTFKVTDEDGNTVYNGGIHEYAYINENLFKYNQKATARTIDNWTDLDDSSLYLYVTGEIGRAHV